MPRRCVATEVACLALAPSCFILAESVGHRHHSHRIGKLENAQRRVSSSRVLYRIVIATLVGMVMMLLSAQLLALNDDVSKAPGSTFPSNPSNPKRDEDRESMRLSKYDDGSMVRVPHRLNEHFELEEQGLGQRLR